jgi:hypothetical protein
MILLYSFGGSRRLVERFGDDINGWSLGTLTNTLFAYREGAWFIEVFDREFWMFDNEISGTMVDG